MESTRLGRSELEVSRVGLGCNNFGRRIDRGATRRVVEAALDAGITFFDTAESYGEGDSERFLGAALGERRSHVVVATKFGWAPADLPGGDPERVRRATVGSLERLGTDVVDLLYYHRPDGVTPLAETLGAMQELVEAGKVRALGLSNVDVGLLDRIERGVRIWIRVVDVVGHQPERRLRLRTYRPGDHHPDEHHDKERQQAHGHHV